MKSSIENKTYILSPFVQLRTYKELLQEWKKQDWKSCMEKEKIEKGELFVLRDEHRDFLINPTTKIFLELFHLPFSLEKAVKTLAAKANCAPQLIQHKIQFFLEDMLRKEFLIPAFSLNKVVEKKEKNEKEQFTFPISHTVAGYKIIDCVAQKSQYDIYLAERSDVPEKIIIKTINYSAIRTPSQLKKLRTILRQEFALLSKLKGHPNVCQFIDFQETASYCFGVMEWLPGKNPRTYIKQDNLTWLQRKSIIDQIFKAVAHIHKRKIIHGDLHLSNFRIMDNGIIKLFDFDLGNHQTLEANELERGGGVRQYLPPEKITANSFKFLNSRIDLRAEVYQAAIVAYYILYERLPFEAFSWQELFKKIKTEPPILSTTLPNGQLVPLEAMTILKKALSKSPIERFSSGIELKEAWIRFN